MSKVITIAPSPSAVRINKNVVSVVFNGEKLIFTMVGRIPRNSYALMRKEFCTAIAMSSKFHQLKYIMENGLKTASGEQLGVLTRESCNV